MKCVHKDHGYCLQQGVICDGCKPEKVMTIDDLKCCGNCQHYLFGRCNVCFETPSSERLAKNTDELCKSWQWDQLKAEDRK